MYDKNPLQIKKKKKKKKSGFRSESEDCPGTENKSHCIVEDTHTNTHIIELMETVKLDVPYH